MLKPFEKIILIVIQDFWIFVPTYVLCTQICTYIHILRYMLSKDLLHLLLNIGIEKTMETSSMPSNLLSGEYVEIQLVEEEELQIKNDLSSRYLEVDSGSFFCFFSPQKKVNRYTLVKICSKMYPICLICVLHTQDKQ